MRWAAVLLLPLLVSGCGGKPGPQGPLPTDFTVTQPAGPGTPVDASYVINVTAPARLEATLVWGTAGNRFDLDLTAGGSGGQQGTVDGPTSRLNWTLSPATYELRVSGTPVAADVWHLEAHFVRP